LPAPAHQVTGRKPAGICALDCMPRVSGTVRSTAFHGCAVSWSLFLLEFTGHVQVIDSLNRTKEKATQFVSCRYCSRQPEMEKKLIGQTQSERLLTAAIAWSLFPMLLQEKGNLYILNLCTLYPSSLFLP